MEYTLMFQFELTKTEKPVYLLIDDLTGEAKGYFAVIPVSEWEAVEDELESLREVND